MVAVGAEVSYRFSVRRYEHGCGEWHELRTGRGVVVGTEDYSVWPGPGYTVRVTESPNYQTGEILHLCGVSLV